MVPNFSASLKRIPARAAVALLAVWQAWRQQAGLLAMTGLCWLLAVCLPRLLLVPSWAADEPAVRGLLVLPPLAALAAAVAWQRPWLTLMTGLGACVPPLVAVPSLLQTAGGHPWRSFALAVSLLAAVDAAWRADRGSGGLGSIWPRGVPRRSGLSPLRNWTRRMAIQTALGTAWLAMAWWTPSGGPQAEAERALRTVAAGACWALLVLPVPPPHTLTSARLLWRRLAWLVLFGGLWWLWRRDA